MSRCDFCNEPNPSWLVPSKSFEVMGTMSLEEWLACDVCAKLVMHNQWSLLLTRVREFWWKNHDKPMSPLVVETMRLTYSKLRENITGPVRKI
ncbi:hypothetical protein PP460_gp155 [Streptomyces phage Muntaha]|uniref:Uncharacterized protein n=1 Tax=Streptomyces phage Muntaha TaxID=2713269 RepID=A0A6G8R372_9CAUD|nr:hypothetical protein PP460_gp155 [Streptomyces phage Muntaha]QIN94647.1 hypothetical protein SEA_MUNTAHA_99 [Streptomyces phage Muntaha]